MPNRNRVRRVSRRKAPRGMRGGQIERISGRAVFSAGGLDISNPSILPIFSITVHPTFPSAFIVTPGTPSVTDWGVSKLQALSLLFRYYRCVKLNFRWLGGSVTNSTASSGGLGLYCTYLGGDTPNADAPSTVDEVMEQPFQVRAQQMDWSSDGMSQSRVSYFPSVPKMESFPRSMLFGRQPLKWWLCERDMTTAVAPGMMVYQGQLFVCPVSFWMLGAGTPIANFQFELDYTFEFTEFQAHPTGMISGGLKQKLIQEKESDEKSDDEVELDDASLMIIANNSTGLGAKATASYLAERSVDSATGLQRKLDQAKWDEAIARAKISRLETKMKEQSPTKVIITPQ